MIKVDPESDRMHWYEIRVVPISRDHFHECKYSTDQMQGISLMHLSLATNAFIADNKRIYC